MRLTFPDDFLWGTSSSATQIETCGDNEWKNAPAIRGSGPSLERAIEHELHQEEDAEIIASLGNAHRFSFAWDKLQAEPRGQFNAAEVERYRNFLGMLKDKDLTLMNTLHHFSHPQWFFDAGGWKSEESASIFSNYAQQIETHFGDCIDYYITFNEPVHYVGMTYLLGEFPPYQHWRFGKYHQTIRALGNAHSEAFHALKEERDVPIGIAKGALVFAPETTLAQPLASLLERGYMWKGIDHFKELDFIGLNYYGKVPMRPLPVTEVMNPGKLDALGRVHDHMWERYPQGLHDRILKTYERYEKPIIITENGTCTHDDNERISYIREHVQAMHEAMDAGADVLGYFYWSAIDNHEWSCGIVDYPFGLYGVDEAMHRIKRPSADVYARLKKENGLDV